MSQTTTRERLRATGALQELLELHRPYLRRVVRVRMDTALAGRVDPSGLGSDCLSTIISFNGSALEGDPENVL